MGRLLLAVLALVLVPGPIAGQRVWIVDSNNGPGTDFTDIPPAVAAAAVGDTLSVRPGAYTGAAIQRGLSIVPATPTSTIMFTGTFTVQGLRAGERVVLQGLQFLSLGGFQATPISCSSCLGTVHLSAVSFLWLQPGHGTVQILGCRLVTLDQCRIQGLNVNSATVVLSRSDVRPLQQNLVVPACRLTNAHLTVVDGSILGHNGWPSPPFCGPATEGIACTGGQILMMGSAGVAGGAGGGGWCPYTQADAVTGTGSVTREATTTLGRVSSAGIQVAVRHLPHQLANGAPPGGALTTELRSQPAVPTALFVSVPRDALATPFGALWLDPSSLVQIDAGATDAAGRRTLRFPILPFMPLGLALGFQSAVLLPGGVELTNPMVVPLS